MIVKMIAQVMSNLTIPFCIKLLQANQQSGQHRSFQLSYLFLYYFRSYLFQLSMSLELPVISTAFLRLYLLIIQTFQSFLLFHWSRAALEDSYPLSAKGMLFISFSLLHDNLHSFLLSLFFFLNILDFDYIKYIRGWCCSVFVKHSIQSWCVYTESNVQSV